MVDVDADSPFFGEEIDQIIDLCLTAMVEKFVKNESRENLIRPGTGDNEIWGMVEDSVGIFIDRVP